MSKMTFESNDLNSTASVSDWLKNAPLFFTNEKRIFKPMTPCTHPFSRLLQNLPILIGSYPFLCHGKHTLLFAFGATKITNNNSTQLGDTQIATQRIPSYFMRKV